VIKVHSIHMLAGDINEYKIEYNLTDQRQKAFNIS